MISTREAVELVDRLTRETQNGSLDWHSQGAPYHLTGPDVRVDLVYDCEYLGKNFRVYKKQWKYYTDEINYFWDSGIAFEAIDPLGNTVFVFPSVNNLASLFAAVTYQNSGMGDFLRQLKENG